MENLRKIGFSLWCDFIEREFLNTRFKELVNNGIIYGATSNPAIFANAILKSNSYKNDKEKLKGKNPKEIYENLAFSDIANAADSMLELYKANNDDGFISIEIDPFLCNDATKSIDEGKRIFKSINKPNVMIKVPATNAGFEVINELTKSNINVNATLIFSPLQAKSCMESINKNSTSKCVISVFVSRFDRFMQDLAKNNAQDSALQTKSNANSKCLEEFLKQDSTPKLGIYNAIKCRAIVESFNNANTRALFASTGVKDSFINDNYYVESLLSKNTINTAPLGTIESFIKNGNKTMQSEVSLDLVEKYLSHFNMNEMYDSLLESGLNAFIESFETMLKAI